MKKVILMAMICVSVVGFGQNKDTVFIKSTDSVSIIKSEFKAPLNCKSNIEYQYFILNKNKSEIDYKTGWTRYNMMKFYTQHRASTFYYAVGAGTVLYSIINTKDNNPLILPLAGIFSIIGLVLDIDSYKWIKRASISPSMYGISYKIDIK